MHQLAVLHARRLTGQRVHRRNGLVQCLHIPGKRRVVKILVKDTQIPYLVHVRSSFSDRRLPAGFFRHIISHPSIGYNHLFPGKEHPPE